MLSKFKDQTRIQLVAVYLVALLSLSLALWWIFYFVFQLNQLSFTPEWSQKAEKMKNMLIYEGMTLVVLLLGSFAALIYLVHTERKRRSQLSQFFSLFTHDLKTSLASLNLQLDRLGHSTNQSPQFINEIRTNSNRLEVQLENSLLIANEGHLQLFFEDLTMGKLISSLRFQWPDLSINLEKDMTFKADYRLMSAIIRNLFQNAVTHGGATEVSVEVVKGKKGVLIQVTDNGSGYSGDVKDLGKNSLTNIGHSQSGLGLYLTSSLLKKMDGEIVFENSSKGLRCQIHLKREA